jgi:EAL domain-containing protein (putative c-di-GMP-specific phosphodiesterase class I)
MLQLGASVGLARAPDHGQQLSSLIGAADLAAMEAKRLGGGQVCEYTLELSSAWRRRREIERALAKATLDGSLVLHYQPIVGRDGVARQLEALLRWESAVLGPVSPVEFIPIAEESGAIQAIGDWVLDAACRDAAGWQSVHPTLSVAVNVSMPQLRSESFHDRIVAALERHALAADRLVIEVTESAFAETRDEQVLRTLCAIAEMGVRIEVDDFGIGYSSLSRLHRYPLAAIKIDRQFVTTLDDSARTIVAAVRLIADRFGLVVIAEGVEDAARANALLDMGADALQGYWLGRPKPLGQALHDLAKLPAMPRRSALQATPT